MATPTITTWSGVTYSQINLTTTGDSPQSLNSVGGYRNGQTWGWNAGANVIGGCSGTEYWTVSNAAGVTGRFYTVAGTPYVPGTTGSINNTLAAPTAAFGRGSSYGVDWGVPAMAAHANFPYSQHQRRHRGQPVPDRQLPPRLGAVPDWGGGQLPGPAFLLRAG